MFRKLIFIALILLPGFCQSQVGKYEDFFNHLPTDTTFVDSGTIKYNEYWKTFVNIEENVLLNERKIFAKANKSLGSIDIYKRPDLSPLLSRKLYFNQKEIVEKKSKEANNIIGFTKCDSGNPVIIYAEKESPTICMEAFVFFREHEYAHFKLGHAGCGLTSDVFDNHRKELEADLEARNTILNYSEGYRIIDFIIATFSALNLKQDQYHPSSIKRIQNLILN